jgi:hypothetical protein
MVPEIPPFDLSDLRDLHHDDAEHPALPSGVLGAAPAFPYVGQALTLAGFVAYLASYDFGTIPPDGVVLHHTAVPDASWAPGPGSKASWDAGETGLSAEQIRLKRLRQLGAIKTYYQQTLLWPAGPHLFIDDRWVFLMSPMAEPGIHAKWANSWRDADGRLHYPIAAEVVGDYTRRPWPPAVVALVGGAVQALQKRLGTFRLHYLYPTPESKPGMVIERGVPACAHPERLRGGGISSHRDYNKFSCPGNAVSEAFYMAAITGLPIAPEPGATITEDTPLLSVPRCTLPQLHRAFIGQTRRGYSDRDIHETILPTYWRVCVAARIDPLLVLAQLIAETSERWPNLKDSPYAPLCSFWSSRPHRNPAGIGVNGRWSREPAPGYVYNTDRHRYEQGLSFKTWIDDAIPAHVGRLLAYALPLGQGDAGQQALIARALGYRALPIAMRGSAPTLKRLGKAHNPTGNGWASPGVDYGRRIAQIATGIIAQPG